MLMNNSILEFSNIYIQLLTFNFMIYAVLINSYKLKTVKKKSYLLAFFYANIPSIIIALLIINIGSGVLTIKPINYLIQINTILEFILVAFYIRQVIDIVWYKIYWWYLISFIVLSIPNRLYIYSFLTYGERPGFTINLFNLRLLYYDLLILLMIFALGVLLIYISKRISISNRFSNVSKWNWYIIYSICGSILVWSSNRGYKLEVESRYDELAAYIIFTIVILSIAINHSNKKILIIENTFLNQQKDLQYAEYQELQQHEAVIHKLYHDIGNHISTIQVLLESEEMSEADGYMQRLMELHQDIKRDIYCTNKIINAVLMQKSKLCNANGINFQTELLIPEQLPYQDMDLMSLYSELIDIAIKGCLTNYKVDNYVNVKSGVENNYLYLMVSCNRIDKNVLNIANKEHRKLLNAEMPYNIQLNIINEIVRRLGGKREIVEDNKGHTTIIRLPMELKLL